MRHILLVTFGFCLPALAAEVPVLVYHDIVRTGGDAYSVRASDFRDQMEFLKRQGWHPIRLADYARAATRGAPLPPKPVILSFDDGLKSFQDIALPILEKHQFPAALSVTTAWLDGRSTPDSYRGRLLNPEQLNRVSQSPLVEILSHTDSLHDAVRADALGTAAAGSVTRRYLGDGRLESETGYRARVRADLQRSQNRLREVTGHAPMAVVWPYGDFNPTLVDEAASLGMAMHLSLDDAMANTQEYPLIRRRLLEKVKTLGDFEQALHPLSRPPAVRLFEFRLDDLVGSDPRQTEQRIAGQIERVRLLRANTAIVSAYTRDGRAAFYASSGSATAGDVLFRVLHQLRNAAGVQTLILRLPDSGISATSYQELVRRHPFDAIVLGGKASADDAAQLLRISRAYRSTMRCGVDAERAVGVCNDFRLLRVNRRTVEAATRGARKAGQPPVYLLLENDSNRTAVDLARTLRRIRLAGNRNVGIEDGPVWQDPVGFRTMAFEFAQEGGGRAR